MLYVRNIAQIVLFDSTPMTSICIQFCRELNPQFFGKKTLFETMKTEKDIEKILAPPFILAHPLSNKKLSRGYLWD
jgi:hypothetical protein